jgi:hypothetical protein
MASKPMELNQGKILVMFRRPQLSAASPPPVAACGYLLDAIRVGLMLGSRVNASQPYGGTNSVLPVPAAR